MQTTSEQENLRLDIGINNSGMTINLPKHKSDIKDTINTIIDS